MEEAEITERARRVTDGIAESARTSPNPVAWVTGNRYMPPLRSFATAEEIWQSGDPEGEDWALFCELVEKNLDELEVLCTSPDYDNALYAVDLKRWQFRDEPAGDDLNDEWEPRT